MSSASGDWECCKRVVMPLPSYQTADIIPSDLATRRQHMVGFRNVAVHECSRLNLDVVHAIITKQLDDFRTFSSTMVKAFP
jgi:uncharacterized protein YutE (UPF0331/DUF86 family)